MSETDFSDEFSIEDILPADQLQELQNSFFRLTRCAMGVYDMESKPITRQCKAHDFCIGMTQQSEEGKRHCQDCDMNAVKSVMRSGKPYVYLCHNEMVDFMIPIMVGQKPLGAFFGGQIFPVPPKEEKIKARAVELGLDPEAYWAEAQKVPVRSYEEVRDMADFVYKFCNMLSLEAVSLYKKMQENVEIEREASMKSDFLANMSHEIRTPMNGVIGMAEMALREDLPPTARDYIEQIQTAGQSLLTIINDILDFSKIDSGKMDINMVEYEPAKLIRETANILMSRVKTKNIELVVDYDTNIPKFLMGDDNRIKQIITNLANNAVKFTNDGKVVIKVGYSRVDDHQVMLNVDVIDTGIGIKEKDLNVIFESFQQVDSKRNRNVEGTGLGLAICKQLVGLMKGKISVKSDYGKGSTFSISIPQVVLRDEPTMELKERRSIVAGIFTDNPVIFEHMKADLEKFNVKVRPIFMLQNLTELATENAEFLFVDQPMFNDEVKSYLQQHPRMTCALISAYDSKISDSAPNLVILKRPLNTVQTLAVLNHEEINNVDAEDDTQVAFDFVAPEAEVLLVDDNKMNLTVAEGLMEPLQMKVDSVLSGKECLDKIIQKHYDIIFMDHMMPDVDGVETTRIIRRMYPDYNDVPIIALTANAMEEAKSMFLVEGMNDFITKPIELKKLLEVLKRWLPKEKIHTVTEKERKTVSMNAQILSEDSKLGKLKASNELNVDGALKLLGSEKLYKDVLKDYYKVIDRKISSILSYSEKTDWRNYEIEVHALKSASKQIGAGELSALAAELESAAASGKIPTIVEKTPKAIKLYRHIQEVLKPYFEEKEETQAPKAEKRRTTVSELRGIFQKIYAAIDELDMDGIEEGVAKLDELELPDEQQMLLLNLTEEAEKMDVESMLLLLDEWESIL